MKPLLPDNKVLALITFIFWMMEKLFSNSTISNHFFVNPKIQDSALGFTEEDFKDRPSIAAVKSKPFYLNFALEEIKMLTITDHILKMNAKKSTGPDRLLLKVLKVSATAVASPLISLFNYCILPISVLSAISKLFGKAMFNQLYAFLTP